MVFAEMTSIGEALRTIVRYTLNHEEGAQLAASLIEECKLHLSGSRKKANDDGFANFSLLSTRACMKRRLHVFM
jgi:hypothetical protein